MAESEDTEITDEKLTAVYSRAADARVTEEGWGGGEGAAVGRGRREERAGGGGGRRRREFKAAINLMEKSNTKQIHSSKLDARLVLFSPPPC